MENRRVYDYTTFSSDKKKKNKNFDTDMNFSCELREIDIDLYNKPKELKDINSSECEIDYVARIISGKTGISTIEFSISSIELEIKVDNHPDEDNEYEIDIIPGKDIDVSNVIISKGDILTPSEPTKIEIDMANSMEPKEFRINVIFGHDR